MSTSAESTSETMAKKGYGLAFLHILDPAKWKSYAPQGNAISKSYGARPVAAGKIADSALYAENGSKDNPTYHIAALMEYPSIENAKSFYESTEYQSGPLQLRQEAAEGPFVMVEGVERPSDYTGFVFASIKATNADKMKQYDPSSSIQAFGGKLLFRSREPPIADGFHGAYDFAVALAFPTGAKALEWMKSPEYKEMLELRLANSMGPLVIFNGSSA